MRVLLLAGTAEARELSLTLEKNGVDLVTSLAGATDRPAPQGGTLRRGGFGGAAGLASFVREAGISHIIDATHPFAARMSENAANAAADRGVALLQVVRPAWPEKPDWQCVDDLADAVGALARASRVFLSTGRNSLRYFAGRADVHFLARVIDDRPGAFPLTNGGFLIGQPPFSIQEEVATMREHRIDTLVSRNSGGSGGIEKLLAAEALGLRIIMVRRPQLPDATRVETVADAVSWIAANR